MSPTVLEIGNLCLGGCGIALDHFRLENSFLGRFSLYHIDQHVHGLLAEFLERLYNVGDGC